MLKLLFSFLAASLISAAAFNGIMVLLDHPAFIDPYLSNILFTAIAALAFILVLGFPWLSIIRRYSLVSYWQVIGLAGVMASAPFLFYCGYVLIVELGNGENLASLARDNWRDVFSYLSFFVPMGLLCGAIIWALGVRGNTKLKPQPVTKSTTKA